MVMRLQPDLDDGLGDEDEPLSPLTRRSRRRSPWSRSTRGVAHLPVEIPYGFVVARDPTILWLWPQADQARERQVSERYRRCWHRWQAFSQTPRNLACFTACKPNAGVVDISCPLPSDCWSDGAGERKGAPSLVKDRSCGFRVRGGWRGRAAIIGNGQSARVNWRDALPSWSTASITCGWPSSMTPSPIWSRNDPSFGSAAQRRRAPPSKLT